jgi:hypothetical protein
MVTRTLKGALRAHGRQIRRKSALTTADLHQLISSFVLDKSLEPLTLNDALFITLLLTGFFGLLRLGELTLPNDPSIVNPSKTVQRTTLRMTSANYQFMLPANKVDPFFEGNRIIIRSTDDVLNPRSHFLRYLAMRDSRFPFHSQLFLDESGSIPTRRWFLSKLHQFLPGEYGGQSLRAGGATWLAQIGTPPHIIQAIGRWNSDTWKIYIRQHPILLQSLTTHS